MKALKAVTETRLFFLGRMLLFVCNKTGSYIFILTYKELNPIRAAQTPKSLYTSP